MTKEKLTCHDIDKLANDIANELRTSGYARDVMIYYNNQRMDPETKEIEYNIDPHDYFEYAAYNHIISLSFEGPLYYYIDRHYNLPPKIEKLLEINNLYYEFGNDWNLTLFPIDNSRDIEYTIYKEKPQPITISYPRVNECDDIGLQTIMKVWYDLGKKEPDEGCCVIGESLDFTLNGKPYRMYPYTGQQGELTWLRHLDTIKQLLKMYGATDIIWHPGQMD